LSYEERVGDLFEAGHPGVGHGCNCAGAMGKGIAVEFRRRWPEMFEEYKRRCEDGSFALGDVFMWEAADRVVFNLGTQETWPTRAELWAIEAAVAKMLALAEEAGLDSVGLPRLGAGLGGLSWPEVAAVIEPVAAQSPVSVVVYRFEP
jgi:O-acetyl-ADP-ribose deacetylase (regulator of RNase III)